MDALTLEFETVISHLIRLLAAFLLALPIGWNRERSSSGHLGLRTFPLVSMASCGYVLLGQVVLVGEIAAQARIFQGLITGVGFLGGAAIIKRNGDVQGTATAASIWTTACIGASVAHGRLEIALVLALATFGVLLGMPPVQEKLAEEDQEET